MRRLWTVLALLVVVLLASAPMAHAAEGPMGGGGGWLDRIWNGPGSTCVAEPPRVQPPAPPLAGAFMERIPPVQGPGVPKPGRFEERGFAGLSSFTFDLGCDPLAAGTRFQNGNDSGLASRIVGLGFAATAAADYLDRKSWDPTWIARFFGELSSTLVNALRLSVFLPYIALGLIFTSVVLLYRSRHGKASMAAAGSAWAAAVVVGAVLVMSSPLLLPNAVQSGSSEVVTSLYPGTNPATAQTERTMEAIHYQGWIRRTFGEQPTDAALKAAPMIYMDTGWSWAEYERARKDPKYAEAAWGAKMISLNVTLARFKDADPQAYRTFTGADGGRIDHALTETGYALAADFFRIAAAVLRILCIVAIFVLGLVWLAASPFLVTPQGEGTGRSLLNNTLRAVGYVLGSIVCSFGYGVWAFYAMDPDVPRGTSLILLVVGTAVFWALLRPDRKILSLATMGKVDGVGQTSRWLLDKLATVAAVRLGTSQLAPDLAAAQHNLAYQYKPVPSEEYVAPTPPPVHEGEVVEPWAAAPSPGLPRSPGVVDGEVVYDYDTTYQRTALPAEPTPDRTSPDKPADGVVYGEVELYQRPPSEAGRP